MVFLSSGIISNRCQKISIWGAPGRSNTSWHQRRPPRLCHMEITSCKSHVKWAENGWKGIGTHVWKNTIYTLDIIGPNWSVSMCWIHHVTSAAMCSGAALKSPSRCLLLNKQSPGGVEKITRHWGCLGMKAAVTGVISRLQETAFDDWH